MWGEELRGRDPRQRATHPARRQSQRLRTRAPAPDHEVRSTTPLPPSQLSQVPSTTKSAAVPAQARGDDGVKDREVDSSEPSASHVLGAALHPGQPHVGTALSTWHVPTGSRPSREVTVGSGSQPAKAASSSVHSKGLRPSRGCPLVPPP